LLKENKEDKKEGKKYIKEGKEYTCFEDVCIACSG
jgi:hypothetical protein